MINYSFLKSIPKLVLFLIFGLVISCKDTDAPDPDADKEDTGKEDSVEVEDSVSLISVALQFNIATFIMKGGVDDAAFGWSHVLGGDNVLSFQSSDSTVTFSMSNLTPSKETVEVELPEGDYSLSVSNSSGPIVSNLPLSGFLEGIKVRNDTVLKMNVVPDYGLVLVDAAGSSTVPTFTDSVGDYHPFTRSDSEDYYYLYIRQGTKGAVKVADPKGNVYINEIDVAALSIYFFDPEDLKTVLSDTLVDRSGYKHIFLQGDAHVHERTTNPKALWDGKIDGFPQTVMMTNRDYTPFVPHMITIDLGEEVQLARVHVWDYPEWSGSEQNIYYVGGAMRRFEMYGSVDYNSSGELDDSWTKLGDYESTKPSGLPEWLVNEDDIAAGRAGFDYYVDKTAPKVRYIRFRCLENWSGGTYIALAELEFYRVR